MVYLAKVLCCRLLIIQIHIDLMDRYFSFIHGYHGFIYYNNTNTLKNYKVIRIKMLSTKVEVLFNSTSRHSQLQIYEVYR